MRYPAAEYLLVALGLYGVSLAAPDRLKRQITDKDKATQSYNEFFNIPDNTSSSARLNTRGSNLPTCLCVSVLRCSKNRTPGSNKIDIDRRLGERCLNSLHVCCPRSEITSEYDTTPFVPDPPRQGCGFRNPSGVGVRITGNHNIVQFGEFPWMIVVLQQTVSGAAGTYQCGGSLIHPRVVLTAAHSIEGYAGRPGNLRVRAGEWDATMRMEPIAHQEREVEAVILHENYDVGNLKNDFALLILKTAFDSSPNVNTICLPEETDTFDAQRCIATGWGRDAFESHGRFQAVLNKIELPVVPFDYCQAWLRLTRLSDTFSLDQSFTCAGGEPGLDTCTGDGGSPLVCPLQNAPGRYVQAGIVSWGIGCGQDRIPGVYGNVAKARRWIDRKLSQNNLETSSYVL